MSFNNIIVTGIQMNITAEYIANTFWNQSIARIKSIILTPYLYNSTFYQTAYIHVAEWCDSEIAYNFIKRLQNRQKITRVVHQVDDWWPVAINTMEIKTIMNLMQYSGKYLTTFDLSYYIKEEIDTVCQVEEELKLSKNITLRPHQISYAL